MRGQGVDDDGIEYILPLRWACDDGLAELTAYLEEVREWADVTVVDGSGPELFAAHAAAWAGLVRHLPVDGPGDGNGKVLGVLTGIAASRHERIVLADDDVRYDRSALSSVVAGLDAASLVAPQNHFSPLPWHARWDTGRALLNRALTGDYPGTFAVRRSAMRAVGGYDPGVLFENLELERTVRAGGEMVSRRPDILVRREPPTIRHFVSQRVRQAYDSLAQPGRMLVELAILPTVWVLRRPLRLAALVLATVAVAEYGRRREGGRDVFPASSALWAPVWVAERAITSWIAVGLLARGGVRYGDRRLRVAAHSVRSIRRRLRSLT